MQNSPYGRENSITKTVIVGAVNRSFLCKITETDMQKNNITKIRKFRWQSIRLWILLIIGYSLLTGGGINYLFFYDYDYHQSKEEIFTKGQCFIRVASGSDTKVTRIPFLMSVGSPSYTQSLNVVIHNDNVKITIREVVVNGCDFENIFLIDQTLDFTQDVPSKMKFVHIPNAVTQNESVIVAHVSGIVKDSKTLEEKEFFIE